MEVEEALLRAFIAPERRQRFVKLLASPKKREKLLSELHHLHDLDPRYATRIEPGDQHTPIILRLLRERGAPDRCYVMSASSEFDGTYVDLNEALDAIVARCDGTFISCLPGRLAYFEGEEPNERYLLERPAAEGLE